MYYLLFPEIWKRLHESFTIACQSYHPAIYLLVRLLQYFYFNLKIIHTIYFIAITLVNVLILSAHSYAGIFSRQKRQSIFLRVSFP